MRLVTTSVTVPDEVQDQIRRGQIRRAQVEHRKREILEILNADSDWLLIEGSDFDRELLKIYAKQFGYTIRMYSERNNPGTFWVHIQERPNV